MANSGLVSLAAARTARKFYANQRALLITAMKDVTQIALYLKLSHLTTQIWILHLFYPTPRRVSTPRTQHFV